MSVKACLVVTTIGDGNFLEQYKNQIVEEQLLDNVEIIVIPDYKTPPQLFKRCDQLKRKGLMIRCPSIEEQDTFLFRAAL